MNKLVLAAGFLACSSILGCSGDDEQATASSRASSASSSGAGGAGSSSGTGGEAPLTPCESCLATGCATELAACDDGAFAIEGCIQTRCRHLSEIASSEEGMCQVSCQSEHSASKDAHLAAALCADQASCSACGPFPQDWDACVLESTASTCASEKAACDGSADCQGYDKCVGSCTTLDQCQMCAGTASGQMGRLLDEALYACVARRCLLVGWLP